MNAAELRANLKALGLSQLEAARLLGVKRRTINRWATGSQDVSGPAAQALIAWRRLAARGLAWRPDCVEVRFEAAPHPARDREWEESLARRIESVAARGGPRLRWRISLSRHSVSAGGVTVYFDPVAAGLFVPTGYRRLDGQENPERDRLLIDEAVVVFAKAAEKAAARKTATDGALGFLPRAAAPVPAIERPSLP